MRCQIHSIRSGSAPTTVTSPPVARLRKRPVPLIAERGGRPLPPRLGRDDLKVQVGDLPDQVVGLPRRVDDLLVEMVVHVHQCGPGLLELPGQGLANGLRITIGTEEETRGLAAALRDIVGATG